MSGLNKYIFPTACRAMQTALAGKVSVDPFGIFILEDAIGSQGFQTSRVHAPQNDLATHLTRRAVA